MARRVSRLVVSFCLLAGVTDRAALAQTSPNTSAPACTIDPQTGICVDSEVTVRGTLPGTAATGKTTLPLRDRPLTVDVGYTWQNGLGVNAGIRYLGSTFADNENTFEIDGYGVLNLALHYRRGAIEYGLNVNNVTDTGYFTAHLDYLQVYPGDPINAMATIRVRMK